MSRSIRESSLPSSLRSTNPTVLDAEMAPDHSRLTLLVVGDGVLVSRRLPESGTVVVGRSRQCDVEIDDPSVSRAHVALHLGDEVTIEDLGSANGTRLRGELLKPGTRYALGAGEVADAGQVLLIVQNRATPLGSPGDASGESAAAREADESSDGRSPPVVLRSSMTQLDRLVEKIAAGTISILILGETGVGKEVLAERIHRLSPRSGAPFLRLNCAALSESLLESELFGHERGAFTGAVSAKPGLLETAHGGTVFLDEIGELPMTIQVKLLRVLEERRVQRVGALKPRNIAVRFVAATNRDLELEITRGTFRQDLYFRLAGVTLNIPPLRHRMDELEGLARTFLAEASQSAGRATVPVLSQAALDAMRAYPWPGNIRELRNVVERAVLLCHDRDITPAHLPADKMRARPAVASAEPASPRGPKTEEARSDAAATVRSPGDKDTPDAALERVKQEMWQIERARVVDALEQCAGNQTRAARLLGVSRRTLTNWLDRYQIPRPRKR